MSDFLARAALATYRAAGTLVYPLLGPYVGYRTSRGKEDPLRRRERYGHASVERPAGPLVWVHAASVGESAAVTPLVRAIAAAEEERNLSIETVDQLRRDLKLNHDRANRLLRQNGVLERSLPGSTTAAAVVTRVTRNPRK